MPDVVLRKMPPERLIPQLRRKASEKLTRPFQSRAEVASQLQPKRSKSPSAQSLLKTTPETFQQAGMRRIFAAISSHVRDAFLASKIIINKSNAYLNGEDLRLSF
jgi:hypothetical protein